MLAIQQLPQDTLAWLRLALECNRIKVRESRFVFYHDGRADVLLDFEVQLDKPKRRRKKRKARR